VTIRSFLLGKYEVTQAEWRAVAAMDPLARLDPGPSQFQGDELPVEQVTWNDLQVFQEVSGLVLPTEAQWEYAARAGSAKPFPTGDTVTTDQANFNGQFPYCNEHDSSGLLRSRTLPVGSFEPNTFGLFDMAGNVHEWCQDAYDAEFYSQPGARGVDPVSQAGSPLRVLRGGAWLSIAQHLRCAFRGKSEPTTRFNLIGFRAAMRLEPAAE
jgi:formylglycine-generating enzyme required for sulfatase activity